MDRVVNKFITVFDLEETFLIGGSYPGGSLPFLFHETPITGMRYYSASNNVLNRFI